ncbi:uncharacterized protein LOC9647626 [Selaginella moellendorffii]|uniref:uncharacterized protein LOC9647626 n=1 Tax=Selaginella moellendorffii TaxID=88036 RepID=UPI000D1C9D12|nr:uncharacterized protein LOC9647626 [Selaginella moellendorffii]|eukprot:XP_024519697.1 uncharacterized protein LOC9647626 [Selaginella moellendorffii]
MDLEEQSVVVRGHEELERLLHKINTMSSSGEGWRDEEKGSKEKNNGVKKLQGGGAAGGGHARNRNDDIVSKILCSQMLLVVMLLPDARCSLLCVFLFEDCRRSSSSWENWKTPPRQESMEACVSGIQNHLREEQVGEQDSGLSYRGEEQGSFWSKSKKTGKKEGRSADLP